MLDLIYPNGLSNSLPEDAQEEMYRSVPGLENVELVRPAYGVEYDHVDARELKGASSQSPSLSAHFVLTLYSSPATLETKRIAVSLFSLFSILSSNTQSNRACSSPAKSTVRPIPSCAHLISHTALYPTGTTGYEEAAAQGIIAGINAGLAAQRKPPLVVSRAEGYVGVMIDDLIVKGAEEPCTSFPLPSSPCNPLCSYRR